MIHMRNATALLAVITLLAGIGAAVSGDEKSPEAPPQPTPPRALSEAGANQFLDDLRSAKSIRIDATPAPGAPNPEPETINELRGFGPVSLFAREKILKRLNKGINQLRLRVTEPRANSGLVDTMQHATDLQLLEDYRAQREVVLAGEAFYAEYSKLPSLDGWRILAVQNQPLVVDEHGNVVDDPETYGGRKDGLKIRRLPVIIPINLAKHPALRDALDYRRDLEREVTRQRVDDFNALPFAERERLYARHRDAVSAIRSLGSPTAQNYREVRDLKRQLLQVPHVDAQTLLARTSQ